MDHRIEIDQETVMVIKKRGKILDVTIIHSAEKKTVMQKKSIPIKNIREMLNKIEYG